jgi:hypothetical protein
VTGTIRAYIRSRAQWCVSLAIVGWIVIALGGMLAKSLPNALPRGLLPATGFLLFFGSILALRWMVNCPRCHAKLGQTIAMPLAFSWGSGPKVNFCPYCGVNLDEPRPTSEQPTPSQNPIR